MTATFGPRGRAETCPGDTGLEDFHRNGPGVTGGNSRKGRGPRCHAAIAGVMRDRSEVLLYCLDYSPLRDAIKFAHPFEATTPAEAGVVILGR